MSTPATDDDKQRRRAKPPQRSAKGSKAPNGHNGHGETAWGSNNAKLAEGWRLDNGKWIKPDNAQEWDRQQETQTSGRIGNFMKLASHIKPRNVEWLWKHRLARGAMHLIAGQPSTGKTTLALSIAAIVSSGGTFPDGAQAEGGKVVIWSGEDTTDMTIIPRLMAMGANMDNIVLLSGGEHAFDPREDMGKLADDLEAFGDVKLLILDPVVSVLKGDSHKNAEVRSGLQAFVDILDKRNVVGLGITHFAKNTQGNVTHERVIGSVAFTAVSRVVFATAGGGDGGGDYRLVVAKNNLGPMGGGVAYRINVRTDIEGIDEVSQVVWGEVLQGGATELINEVEGNKVGGRPSKQAPAMVLLRELFKDGKPVLYSEIVAACERHGISVKTLKRAGKLVGLVTGIKADPLDSRSKEMWFVPKETL